MEKAAADYVCICGHKLATHDRPSVPGEPWGRCYGLKQHPGELGMRKCGCKEAWPVEDDE